MAEKRYPTQDIENQGADARFSGFPMREMVGYDPTAGVLRSVTVDSSGAVSTGAVVDQFKVNHMDDGSTAANVLYIGTAKSDGTYCIKKFDETTSALPVLTYATITNNSGVATYDAAWSARGSLTYDKYETAF